MSRSSVHSKYMSHAGLQWVFEFFLRTAPDTLAQAASEDPSVWVEKADRLLTGKLPEAERAAFFQSLRADPELVALLARQIRAKVGPGKSRRRRSNGPR